MSASDDDPLSLYEMTANQIRRYILQPVIDAITENSETHEKVASSLSGLQGQLDAMIGGFEELTSETLDLRSTYPWNLSEEIDAATTADEPMVVSRTMDVDSTITRFEAVSTEAAQQGVGVQLRSAAGEVWVPRDPETDAEFIPLDNHIVRANLNIEVAAGTDIEAVYVNNDPTNAHFAKTILNIREER